MRNRRVIRSLSPIASYLAGSKPAGLDPRAAALMIGSLLLGLSMQRLVDPDTDLDSIRETSLATLRLSFGAGATTDPKGKP